LFTKNLATTTFIKHAKIYCSDEDIESQSFQGEGVRGASTACRATGTNEVDHMPGGIDHMPSGSDYMPSGIELGMMGLIQSMYRIFEFF
jgi:hypothetical protein